MDNLSMAFYAVVCGALAGLAPVFGPLVTRIVIGVITGLAAAFVWPLIAPYTG